MSRRDPVSSPVATVMPGAASGSSLLTSRWHRGQPIAACSVSPPHTNNGTFTRGDGGALTYFYDYGFGTATLVVEPTQRAPGDVCRLIDAGASD